MAGAAALHFAARPAASVIDQLADALGWPRSRPARLLAGSSASTASALVLCADEDALVTLDAAPDVVAVLASAPRSSDGRLGRRAYDPFAGSPDDVSSWRRAERVVLDAGLLLTGGAGGIDEQLLDAIGATASSPARSVRLDVDKFVGYVPVDSFESVRDAVFDAGAGSIGDYDRCSWSTRGTGTFRGGDSTNPVVGDRGEFEQVEEVRFETVAPRQLVDRIVRAYRAAHPYEEAAFDVLAMALPASVGFGRIAALGTGGGKAAWSALASIDPQLTAHGSVDAIPAGASCIIHAGEAKDVLGAILADDALALAVVGSATDAELALLEARGIAVLVVDRAALFAHFASGIAGRLSRRLELPVTVAGSLQFPTASDDEFVSEPSQRSSAPAPSSGTNDYSVGTWRLHFDGGSRGNPGPASYGWALYDPDGNEHEVDGVTVGTATNNVAEWTGLLRGLEHARDRGIRTLAVRGDSELVVKQVTGVYKVKNAALKPLAEQVAALIREFDRVDVKHVYRADNARADELANEALDGLR